MSKKYIFLTVKPRRMESITSFLPYKFEWGEAYIENIKERGDNYEVVVVMTAEYPFLESKIKSIAWGIQ